MKRFLTKLRPSFPIIGILIIVDVLLVLNFKLGTFLTGWDNLHPEFDIALNFKRAIFAVWQEYQGPGLIGGMGHAADLIHVITIAFISLFFPIELLRYVWTFAMLFLGGVGAYLFINYILSIKHVSSEEGLLGQNTAKQSIIPSFLGSLFYILNLATIQMFYVPFEAFISHFAALPWLLLSSILFFQKQSFKNLAFLCVVLLISSPHAYIPTLFVTYMLSVFIIVVTKYIAGKKDKILIFSAARLFGIIFVVNAFWILPFIYFTLTNSSVNLNSKINEMATDIIFARNKEFGTLPEVMILKGFWFANVDPNLNGDFTFMLAPLKKYYEEIPIISIGFAFFAVILLGVISVIKKRDKEKYPFVALFVFAFTMLATATFPFSIIDIIFRKIPLFNQAFRFPFTKFSILTGLMYSLFFAYGISIIIEKLKGRLPEISKKIVFAVSVLLLLIFSFPLFSGRLFYEKEKIDIPKEYFQLFDYFKKQDKNARIANLPQHTFWGWNFYRWGYGGSGFLWYGIQQPILDRAFDVWSKESEQYFFEISNALYAKNPKSIKNVLDKYQVRFLVVDNNTIYPPSPRSMLLEELDKLLLKTPGVSKDASFGKIIVYKVSLLDNPNSFIYTAKNLTSANERKWENSDTAYENLSTYYSSNKNNEIIYPFSEMFSKKFEKDNKVEVLEAIDSIEISRKISPHNNIQTLSVPHFLQFQNIIPVMLNSENDEKNRTVITLTLLTPTISISGRKVYGEDIQIPIFIIPKGIEYPLSININGIQKLEINSPDVPQKKIVTSFISAKQDNLITLSSTKWAAKTYKVTADSLKTLNIKKSEVKIPSTKNIEILTVRVPKLSDSYLNFEESDFRKREVDSCDAFQYGKMSAVKKKNSITLTSHNATNCLTFYSENLLHDQGYALIIDAKNNKGRHFHLWVLNEDEKYSPIDTNLSKNNKTPHAFILPPMEENGRGYSFHLDNQSIGNEISENILSRIAIFQIPYSFIANINIRNTPEKNAKSTVTTNEYIASVNHPNESLYALRLKKTFVNGDALILSQSYNSGWAAYIMPDSKSSIVNGFKISFPFIFGEKLKNHVKVNNWSNGWIIDNLETNSKVNAQNSRIIIVYLPQYLEYIGFVFLFEIIFLVIIKGIIRLIARRKTS